MNMTRSEWLRSLTFEELVDFNVRSCKVVDTDYVFNGESDVLEDRIVDGFITSDGTTFFEWQGRDAALDYERRWLLSKVEDTED